MFIVQDTSFDEDLVFDNTCRSDNGITDNQWLGPYVAIVSDNTGPVNQRGGLYDSGFTGEYTLQTALAVWEQVRFL